MGRMAGGPRVVHSEQKLILMACLDIFLNVINHVKHTTRVFIISGGSSAAIFRCGGNAIILKRLLFFRTIISVRLLYGLLYVLWATLCTTLPGSRLAVALWLLQYYSPAVPPGSYMGCAKLLFRSPLGAFDSLKSFKQYVN